MQLHIYKDYTGLSSGAAAEIIDLVKARPNATLCLATGDSPKLTYEIIVKRAKEENLDFTQCTFIGLDEWVGIPPQNEGSCHYFLKHRLFDPLHIDAAQIHLFDALSTDLAQECIKMDQRIAGKGGIDLMVVGIGMNGHIGFNEPYTPIHLYAHVAKLDSTTQTVGQKYFDRPETLKQGLTLGLRHLSEAGTVILVANGRKKAEVIQKALEGAIDTALPASILRTHPGSLVMIDEEAAALLK